MLENLPMSRLQLWESNGNFPRYIGHLAQIVSLCNNTYTSFERYSSIQVTLYLMMFVIHYL